MHLPAPAPGKRAEFDQDSLSAANCAVEFLRRLVRGGRVRVEQGHRLMERALLEEVNRCDPGARRAVSRGLSRCAFRSGDDRACRALIFSMDAFAKSSPASWQEVQTLQ